MTDRDLRVQGSHTRHARDTIECNRVVNLSDAPFAIALTLLVVTFGAVALIPFSTSLLGRDPTVRGSVVPYLALLGLVMLLFTRPIEALGAWRAPAGYRDWV